jgi:succinate dehydrogenase / fumarate reductase flavoprotein subunit
LFLQKRKAIREGKLKPTQIVEADRDYYLERRYPAFGNLVRDVASRALKKEVMLALELIKQVKQFI